jgi:hypothetical protein
MGRMLPGSKEGWVAGVMNAMLSWVQTSTRVAMSTGDVCRGHKIAVNASYSTAQTVPSH